MHHMERKCLAENRKARHQYHFCERLEVGISLTGDEVKSLRGGHADFSGSYVEFHAGEAWVRSLHIAPYGEKKDGIAPDRPRRLLLHAAEIRRLSGKVREKGLTVIPVKMYVRQGKIKLEIALARGKKLFDHRRALQRRIAEKEKLAVS